MSMNNPTAACTWGALAGSIYYRTGFVLRGKTIWTSPSGSRAAALPVARFKPGQRGRWGLDMTGISFTGIFSMRLEADGGPLIGMPKRKGELQTSTKQIVQLRCENHRSRLLSILAPEQNIHLALDRLVPANLESDIVLEDSRLGELAVISRRGFDTGLRDQIGSGFGLGLAKRGFFKDEVTNHLSDRSMIECVLAALCLYFYSLEPLLNTEYPSG